MTAILATHALSKHYGPTLALDHLELELAEGGIFGFLGPNGSGKTTTIRLLLGLLRPSAGHARIFGLDCWRAAHRIKREVGYLPGDLRLWPAWNGLTLLRIFGRARGRDLVPAGRALAERFALDLTQRPAEMSRGTRQKLGLILALAHAPRLIVLDEPTSGLDPIVQNTLKDHLRELAGRGHTVFFSSHTLSEVEQLCDRVAILRQGRLVADSTLEDLRGRARREVRLRWLPGASPPPPPAGLVVEDRRGAEWLGRWAGPVGPLLEWLAAAPVDDVTITPPELESLFQEYYRE